MIFYTNSYYHFFFLYVYFLTKKYSQREKENEQRKGRRRKNIPATDLSLFSPPVWDSRWVNQLCRTKFHNTIRYTYPAHGLESILTALTSPVVLWALQAVLPDHPDGARSAENLAQDAAKDDVGPRFHELEEGQGQGLVIKFVIFHIVEPFDRTESAP